MLSIPAPSSWNTHRSSFDYSLFLIPRRRLAAPWYFYMHEFNLEGKLLVIKDQVENKFIWAEVMSKEFEY